MEERFTLIKRYAHPAWLVAGALILAVVGCSHDGFESQVSGRVTLDGKSIGPGAVVFAPLEGKRNPATGAIQPNGSYSLKTANTPGLMAGRYKVSVTVIDEPTAAPGERNMTPGKLMVPEKYTDVNSSGLQYDVASGSNTINIEMSSK